MIHIGMVALYFELPNGLNGYAKKAENGYQMVLWNVLPTKKPSPTCSTFGKQIRQGQFLLPHVQLTEEVSP